VGGFAVQANMMRGKPLHGWQWTIWELMWLSSFCLLFLFFALPETSSPNILYRRTKRLRQLTGDDRLTCEPEMAGEKMGPKDVRIDASPIFAHTC